jgi:hypothetical protein
MLKCNFGKCQGLIDTLTIDRIIMFSKMFSKILSKMFSKTFSKYGFKNTLNEDCFISKQFIIF